MWAAPTDGRVNSKSDESRLRMSEPQRRGETVTLDDVKDSVRKLNDWRVHSDSDGFDMYIQDTAKIEAEERRANAWKFFQDVGELPTSMLACRSLNPHSVTSQIVDLLDAAEEVGRTCAELCVLLPEFSRGNISSRLSALLREDRVAIVGLRVNKQSGVKQNVYSLKEFVK